mgnify:CR=1 FL=1
MARKRKYRSHKLIGFYTDEEGRVRPITKGVGKIHKKLKHPITWRTEHALRTDRALKARIAPSAEAWLKNPNRYDLEGVDTGTKTWKRTKQTKRKQEIPEEFTVPVKTSSGTKYDVKLTKISEWEYRGKTYVRLKVHGIRGYAKLPASLYDQVWEQIEKRYAYKALPTYKTRTILLVKEEE